MKRSLLLLLALPLLLTSCSPHPSEDTPEIVDDDGADATQPIDPVVLTGQFDALNVTGLTFVTQTQTGTLENGAFDYVEGETVVVKTLGVDLFEFPGELPTELADFVSDYPNTESDFGDAFFNDSDFVEFQKFANLIQLLANLDADSNAENGFDLTAFSAIGSVSTVIDLSLPPFEFYEETLIALANELEINRAVTPIISLSYLYDIAEQTMVTFTDETYSKDSDYDGALDGLTTYSYSPEGHKELASVHDGQSVLNDAVIYETNTQGLLTEKRYPRYNSSGEVTFDRGYEYEFNSHGQLVSYLSFYDFNADGVNDSSFTEAYEYDDQGRLKVKTVYSNGDWHISTYEYNEDGSYASVIETVDDNDDSVTDRIITTTYTYDAEGRVTEKREELDEDADGIFEEYDLDTKTYTDDGQILSLSNQTFDSDNVIEFQFVQTNEYDKNGYQIGYVAIRDSNDDDIPEYKSQATYTVNGEGYTTASVEEVFSDGSTLSKVKRYEFEQPELGYFGDYTAYEDSDGDGTEDKNTHYEFTYDTNDNLTEKFTQKDEDNDGLVDSESLFTYTYNEVTNGVGTWLWNYYAHWRF